MITYKSWRSQRESNPCFSLERTKVIIFVNGPFAYILAKKPLILEGLTVLLIMFFSILYGLISRFQLRFRYVCTPQINENKELGQQRKSQRCEVAYGITSLSPQKASPQRLLQLNRGHWGIENGLHYVRDVQEDICQIRTKSAPRMMATLRNLAIGIFRLNKYKNIAKAQRYYSRRPHLTLGLIGL